MSLPLNIICASRSEAELGPEGIDDLGLRNLSKMAITRNIEMRMAVATNPNETAFTELSKRLQCSTLSIFKGATGGSAINQLL